MSVSVDKNEIYEGSWATLELNAMVAALLTLLLALSLVAVFQMPPWIANPLNRAAKKALDELETQFADELLEAAGLPTSFEAIGDPADFYEPDYGND